MDRTLSINKETDVTATDRTSQIDRRRMSGFVHLPSSRTGPCQLKPVCFLLCLFAYAHMDAHMVVAAICCFLLDDCAILLT